MIQSSKEEWSFEDEWHAGVFPKTPVSTVITFNSSYSSETLVQICIPRDLVVDCRELQGRPWLRLAEWNCSGETVQRSWEAIGHGALVTVWQRLPVGKTLVWARRPLPPRGVRQLWSSEDAGGVNFLNRVPPVVAGSLKLTTVVDKRFYVAICTRGFEQKKE